MHLTPLLFCPGGTHATDTSTTYRQTFCKRLAFSRHVSKMCILDNLHSAKWQLMDDRVIVLCSTTRVRDEAAANAFSGAGVVHLAENHTLLSA